MSKEETKDQNKVTLEELKNDQVATLYNLLNSGVQIPARLARDFVTLQEWVLRLTKERKIEIIKDKNIKK